MKNIILLIIIFYNPLFSQNEFLKIENIGDKDYDFPIILSKDSLVQLKINYLIQLKELGLIIGKQKKSIAEKIAPTKESGNIGIMSIGYKILNNTNSSLSILLYIEGCGANCTTNEQFYNFNPQNGDRFSIEDFFNKEELNKLKSKIIILRTNSIKKDVIKAKKEQEINDLDYFEEYIYKNIKKDNLEDFYFTSDSIVFSFENQISRNDKPLDIDSKTVISIKDIKDLLNEFGKKVLLNKQPTKDLISKEEPQIYQGFINSKYPIYFIYWTYYDKDIRSCYAYKKLGESIYFDGKETNNKINLTQESSEDVKVEKFDFTKNNLEIKGDWINKTGSRFPFKANRIY